MNYSEFERGARGVPPAIVLQTSYANGLGIIRALGRAGIPVLAVDPNPRALGFRSRYAAGLVCPDPGKEPEAFLAALQRLGERLPRRAVVFPTHDEFIWPLARHKDHLSQWYRLPLPGWEVMRRLYDKEEQLRAAWKTGVGTPKTVFVRSGDDLEEGRRQIPFPAIFKPVQSLAFKERFHRPVLEIPTATDLEAVYARCDDCGTLMLQEVIPGGDEELFTVGSTLDAQSRPLAVFTGRKLRQHPRRFGTARLAESVWSEELADAGLRLLTELQYHGVSQVEFKRDPRDGSYRLMEVNARHWLWHALAPACGVNLTLASYADAIGKPFLSPPQAADGRKWSLLFKETVDSVNEIRRGEQSPREWLSSLRGIKVDGVLAWDDPAPGLLNAWRLGGMVVQRRLAKGRGAAAPAPAEIEL